MNVGAQSPTKIPKRSAYARFKSATASIPGAPNWPPAENQIITEPMIDKNPKAKQRLLRNWICCLFIGKGWALSCSLQAISDLLTGFALAAIAHGFD